MTALRKLFPHNAEQRLLCLRGYPKLLEDAVSGELSAGTSCLSAERRASAWEKECFRATAEHRTALITAASPAQRALLAAVAGCVALLLMLWLQQ